MGKIKEFLSLFKKNKLITFLVCNLGLLIPAVTISTIAWFSNASQIEPGLTSSVVTSYFEEGTGTQADPYVIYRPVQYYNLVQLQESNPDNFATSSLYFQFGLPNGANGEYLFQDYTNEGVEINGQTSKYLNMSYYDGTNERRTIVPLGTEQLPFVGHIIGNDLTVQNLTVEGDGRADIGIFGYVGATAEVSNIYFKDVRINLDTPSLINTHDNHEDNARIGHIAGHAVNAKASFNHVYTSNNKIFNTSESALAKSDFGDYGKNDAITNTQAGVDSSVSLNPEAINSYLDDNYEDFANEKLGTRNTEYTPTTEYINTALGHSDSNYTLNSTSSRNYSLSTIGRTTDDTLMNYRYLDGTVYRRFPSTTHETETSPSSMNEGGEWVYYDSANGKWIYYVTEPDDIQTSVKNFNCFALSYEFKEKSTDTSTTTYWVKYNSGSLEVTSTAPDFSTQAKIEENADYLWCFRESQTNLGISQLNSDAGGSSLVKIYSPKNEVFLQVSLTNTNNRINPTFVSSYSSATTFTINGPDSAISFFVGTKECSLVLYKEMVKGGYLQYTNEILAGATSGNYEAITFKIWTTDDNYGTGTSSDKPFELVTDASSIATGDIVTFVGKSSDSSTNYVMTTVQNTSNRGSLEQAITNNTIATPPTGMARLEVGSDNGYTTFHVEENDRSGYISSATGSNKITTATTLSDTGRWTITIDSDNMAHIVSNTTDSYTIGFNFTYSVFSSYKATNIPGTQTNYVYLYKEGDGAGTAIISSSISYSHSATEGSTFRVSAQYDTYAAKMNESTTNYTLFTIQKSETATVVFDFVNSKVSVKRINPEAWRLVTDATTLATNDLIIITNTDTQAMSTSASSTNYRGYVSVTKDSSTNTLSFTDTSIAKFKLTKSGSFYYLFDTGTNKYLQSSTNSNRNYRAYLTEVSSNSSSATQWNFSISSGIATVSSNSGYDYKYLHYYGSTSNYFGSYNSGGGIQIYKYYPEELIDKETRFISDEIENGYDPSLIDVVGNATFTSSSITLPAQTDSMYKVGSPTVDSTFYTTAYCPSSVVLYIPNTGSLDLGYLDITYTSGTPQFMAGSNATLDSVDGDESSGHNTININIYNITTISLCGLDADNKIVATNSTMSASGFDFSAVSKFVVVISSASGSLSITNLDYSFVSLEGNTGDHGTSGYMEASYNADGTLNTSNSQLEGTILNFYYDVPTGQRVDVEVTFDKSTMTYNVTFKSTVDMNVNFFNYHAEKYKLKVNGTSYTRGSQTVTIAASS